MARISEHVGYLRTNKKSEASGEYFNLPGHSLLNMKVTLIEKVVKQDILYRKEWKKLHIQKFNTFYNGLKKKPLLAVLAAMIDFKKAFNHQNHAILVTKLGDMGVPGWLLKIVVGFLTDRELVVNYKGETSDRNKRCQVVVLKAQCWECSYF